MPTVLASKRWLRSVSFVLATLCCFTTMADDLRPVQVQIREQEPRTFLVQWQVPRVLPPQAMPVPALPESCRASGERTVDMDDTVWLNRQSYRCRNGLAGASIVVDYPLGNSALTTVVRVELLSGERYAHMLAPGEEAWRLPAGAAPDAPLRAARRAVVTGATHALGQWAHLVFVLAVALLGSVPLVAWFTAGQLVAVLVSALSGIDLEPSLAELSVVLAALLLAKEGLRPAETRRSVSNVTLVMGIVHGFGLAAIGARVELGGIETAMMALGMDVVFLLVSAAAFFVIRRLPFHRVATYAVGAGSVAIGLGLVSSGPSNDAARTLSASRLPALSTGAAGNLSSRLAPQVPDAPVTSFLSIEAFEVRQEVLIRLAELSPTLGLDPKGVVEVEAQDGLKEQIRALAETGTRIVIDGERRDASEVRVDFMTVTETGVLPRQSPVPEDVASAFVGFTRSHLTPTTPRDVTLTWMAFLPEAPHIPSTITDPEATRSARLNDETPSMTWTNELVEDPVPTVEAVQVEHAMLHIPLLSLAFVLLSVWLAVNALRGKRISIASGLARVTLALALLVAPVGTVLIAMPTMSSISPEAARRILANLLPNVYRAFEFRDPSSAYDRLAVSVTGDTLTDIYLEHQRALEMEERGGARARVEAVEVGKVSAIEPQDGGGFEMLAWWQVGGTVTHFGHRHFRQNRYEARVVVVPVEELWKIRTIEVLQEERVR